jgi:hypothetical protein
MKIAGVGHLYESMISCGQGGRRPRLLALRKLTVHSLVKTVHIAGARDKFWHAATGLMARCGKTLGEEAG